MGIDDQKIKLDKEKEKIRLKERVLKEKKRQQRAKGYLDIGRLAGKVDIDMMDREILLGAFLEISEKRNEKSSLNLWKRKAEEFHERLTTSDTVPLSVCFQSQPSKEIKDKLKAMGFRWNSFRKEFYGHGNRENLQGIVDGLDCNIEVLA